MAKIRVEDPSKDPCEKQVKLILNGYKETREEAVRTSDMPQDIFSSSSQQHHVSYMFVLSHSIQLKGTSSFGQVSGGQLQAQGFMKKARIKISPYCSRIDWWVKAALFTEDDICLGDITMDHETQPAQVWGFALFKDFSNYLCTLLLEPDTTAIGSFRRKGLARIFPDRNDWFRECVPQTVTLV